MPATLYYMPESPPARGVILLIRYLGLNDINLKLCRTFVGENKEPEFLAKNPQGTVPFLDDNGFFLSESRAILFYLVDSRAPESSLLGRFPKKRALIHQRLHYELGTIGPTAAKLIRGVFTGQFTVLTEEALQELYTKVNFIEQALEKSQWIAGDNITIADFSYLALFASFVHCGFPIDKKFPKIWAWYQRCKTLPGYEENEEGARAIGHLFKSKLTEPIPV